MNQCLELGISCGGSLDVLVDNEICTIMSQCKVSEILGGMQYGVHRILTWTV